MSTSTSTRPGPGTAVRPQPQTVTQPGSRPVPALLPVTGGELVVPVVDGGRVRQVNLDYAASAPALQAVTDALAQVLPYYASVHRGAGYTSQVSTALYEQARDRIAAFVGARTDDVVVVVRNTTDALNLLAAAVPAEAGPVLVLDLEHHANLLPWRGRAHRVLATQPTLDATLDALREALRQAAADGDPVALVAVTGCSNVTGELLPLEEVVTIAHAAGARVAVDAAQLAPHRRVDLADLDADYLALSGHKVYAPFGAGVLVGRRDWLDAAPPHLAGGGAVRSVSADHVSWAAAPQRHEGGTPNVLGAALLAVACATLAALPDGAMHAHEQELTRRLVTGLQALPGVAVLRLWPDSTERAGVVSFTVAGHDPGRVAAYLSAEHGIGLRDGKFCAHPLLARLGHQQGALRASLGVGSRSEDVDRLLAALADLIEHGERWTYASSGGRWVPRPDPRPAPEFLTGPDLGALLDGGAAAAGASPCQAGD